MRRQTILLTTILTFGATGVLAQGPANLQPGAAGPGPTPPGPAAPGPAAQQQPGLQPGATPGPAGAAPAGGQPTAAQQSLAPTQSEQEPKRAPGSAAEQGTEMPKASEDSGTTVTYAPAQPKEEARWPCVQRRVDTISAGTIWSGPDLAGGKDWDQDNDLASLAQKLASRRTSLEEVDPLIADFAKNAGSDKDKKLTKLFVGVLDIINENRGKILEGIMRYAQGQQRLAERMRDESDKISQAQDEATGNSGVAAQQKNQDFAWDQRIFKERKQALTYVCETPSLLERRAYEIGKRIQAQL